MFVGRGFSIKNQDARSHRYDLQCTPLAVLDKLLTRKIAADSIRILVATDSHVGFEERDPIRKDDSWKSFHEIMCLAKSQDVCIFVH
jgi:hypothetical protein